MTPIALVRCFLPQCAGGASGIFGLLSLSMGGKGQNSDVWYICLIILRLESTALYINWSGGLRCKRLSCATVGRESAICAALYCENSGRKPF